MEKSIQQKINEDYYRTKLEYPRRGKEDPNREALIKAWKEDRCRLEAEFKRDLLDDLGMTDHPKADHLYDLAYQYGHASGYSEIYNYADELAELLK
jgi:hypothetical protein